MSTLYDLDGDGFYDTALPGAYSDYGTLGDSYGGLEEYEIGHGHGHGLGGGYLEYDEGYGYGGGYGGLYDGYDLDAGYYPDLYSYTEYLPDYDYSPGYDGGLSLYDAWRDSSWEQDQRDEQYYQRQLDADRALSESERLARWESRLAWEQLSDSDRALRYAELDPYTLSTLGLSGGFWGRRFGGRGDLDLSYLREVPVRRGLFRGPYRESFVRYPTLANRYSPYFSRQRFRGLSSASTGVPIPPRPTAAYGSGRISAGQGRGMSLRERELMGRLRMAETRASLTSLPAPARAAALSDARRLRSLLNEESRLSRSIDRAERREDALLAAREAQAEREEMREEVREMEGLARLERAAGELVSRPIGGGYY
ncbi:hypothetical protein JCM8547_001989 [Rhodosporidiobolus lusitaniae]